MNVVFRVDASDALGSGHVMRCLTLAHMARMRGAEVTFISRQGPGDLCDLVVARGFSVQRLPPCSDPELCAWPRDAAECVAVVGALNAPADLLVVDHYRLDARWERALRCCVGRILVIDDLADRPHECDVLLDQNLHDSPEDRYATLVQPGTRVFVGPRFALLRPEFERVRPRPRDHGIGRVLVFFGGSDPTGEAVKLVSAMQDLQRTAPFTTIVLGTQHAAPGEVRAAVGPRDNIEILEQTNEMARLTDEADLGIGTCGGAAWERCLLGLPALVAVTAENQRDDARILNTLGAVRNLGDARGVSAQNWASEIRYLMDDPVTLLTMSQAASLVMRGRSESVRAFEEAVFA